MTERQKSTPFDVEAPRRTVSLPDNNLKEVVKAVEESGGEFLSRGDAARILLEIADAGSSGNWPEGISPWTVGRALGRLMSNNEQPDDYNLSEILRGYIGEPSQPVVPKGELN